MRQSYQSALLKVWAAGKEWQDTYEVAAKASIRPQMRSLYATRAKQLQEVCGTISEAIELLSFIV